MAKLDTNSDCTIYVWQSPEASRMFSFIWNFIHVYVEFFRNSLALV